MEHTRRKPEIQTLDDLFGIKPVPKIDVPEGASFSETVVSNDDWREGWADAYR